MAVRYEVKATMIQGALEFVVLQEHAAVDGDRRLWDLAFVRVVLLAAVGMRRGQVAAHVTQESRQRSRHQRRAPLADQLAHELRLRKRRCAVSDWHLWGGTIRQRHDGASSGASSAHARASLRCNTQSSCCAPRDTTATTAVTGVP